MKKSLRSSGRSAKKTISPMSDKEEIIREFQDLPDDGQRRVCDALAEEDARRKFREMPPEKQQALYDSMAKLFTQLEADWKSKPDNAGKTVKYRELWEEYIKKTEDHGEVGSPGALP